MLERKKIIRVNLDFSFDGEAPDIVEVVMEFPMISIQKVMYHGMLLEEEAKKVLNGEDTSFEEAFHNLLEEYNDHPITFPMLFEGEPNLASQMYNQLFSFWYGISEDKENQSKKATGRQDFDELRDFIAPVEYAAHRWGKTPNEIMETMSFEEFRKGLEGIGYNTNNETEKGQKDNEMAVLRRYTKGNTFEMNKEGAEIEKLLQST